jgi:hypothetical protein
MEKKEERQRKMWVGREGNREVWKGETGKVKENKGCERCGQ